MSENSPCLCCTEKEEAKWCEKFLAQLLNVGLGRKP